MRSFRRFTSGESQAATARCPDSSLAMASPLKKSLRAAERKRADVARARRRWIREQGFLDPAHLVFIDETAVTTIMLRLNGWNPRGERLVSDAPMGHWETVTFIAGLRQTGVDRGTISDVFGQSLRAREGECELGTIAVGKRCQERILATGWAW